MTVAHGGKLIARNSWTESVVEGKCFWISGGNLSGFMGSGAVMQVLDWR